MEWPKTKLSFSFPNYQDSDGHFKASPFSFLVHLLCLPILSHQQSILMHTHKKITSNCHLKVWDFCSPNPESDILETNLEGVCFPPSPFSTDKSWFLEWFCFVFGSKALCCKMNYSYILCIDSNSVWFIKLVNEHLYIIVFFVWAFFVVSLCRMCVCLCVCMYIRRILQTYWVFFWFLWKLTNTNQISFQQGKQPFTYSIVVHSSCLK